MPKFTVGQRVQVSDLSGVDSNKFGVVVHRFPWREQPGAYYEPDYNEETPVMLDDGKRIYMFNNRLKVVPQ